MKVSVFGGSQTKQDSQAYADALSLGALLARSGHVVLTGGYSGTMEAVSRGAASAGGHVIGVTCEELAHYHNRSVNQWVMEEWKKRTLVERLQALIHESDCALALPGGAGTLTEIALMWNLMIAGSLPSRPLIIIGDGWRTVWQALYTKLGDYTPQVFRDYLSFTDTPAQAVELLGKVMSSEKDNRHLAR